MLRSGRRGPTGTRLLWGLAIGLALIGIVVLLLGIRTSGVGPAVSPLKGRTAVVRTAAAHEIGLVRSRPVHLSIPALALSVPVSSLGLNADGTVNSYPDPTAYQRR